MSKVVWKPGTLLAPVPAVFVSCGSMEQPNVMTAAWTGIACTQPATTYVSIRPQRYSYGIIERTGEFAINMPDVKLVKALDFCGVKSGLDTDKYKECGITPEAASQIGAPLIAQCPVSIECRVTKKLELGSHDMFLAHILAVHVREDLIDSRGRMQLEKAGLLAYAHGTYFALGSELGTFGFSVRKKKPGKAYLKKKRSGER